MKILHILFVEDNDGDILLTTDALDESKLSYTMKIAKDGWQAVQYVEKAEDGSIPDLVLLDVNLPKMNGHEVLKIIKSNERIKHVPVIMLTTSSAKKDIMNAYDNHANCYITKPTDASEFSNVISSIEHFWTSVAKLPHY